MSGEQKIKSVMLNISEYSYKFLSEHARVSTLYHETHVTNITVNRKQERFVLNLLLIVHKCVIYINAVRHSTNMRSRRDR